MQHYKDQQNNIHHLDSTEFEFLLPFGCVKITDEEAGEILLSKIPVVDPQVAIEAKKIEVRKVRSEILNRLVGIAGAASSEGDLVTATACYAARKSLLDITNDLPATLEEAEAEVLTRYRAIAATAENAAPGLIRAFAGVDL